MKYFLYSSFLFLFASLSLFTQVLTGEEILRKIDTNLNFDTMTYTATMEITTAGTTRTKTMKGQVKGNSQAYMEFLNADDAGKKYLKINKDLWMYFPSENDIVKISGHLLKEGVMGSDISYEDILESDSVYKNYDIVLSREETLNGKDVYVVTLTAKVPTANYYKRIMWVDKKMFIPWKEEMYAKNGKTLLKEMNTLEVTEIAGRYYPTKQEVRDTLRKNSKTVFTTSDMKFNVAIPESLFNLRMLKR